MSHSSPDAPLAWPTMGTYAKWLEIVTDEPRSGVQKQPLARPAESEPPLVSARPETGVFRIVIC